MYVYSLEMSFVVTYPKNNYFQLHISFLDLMFNYSSVLLFSTLHLNLILVYKMNYVFPFESMVKIVSFGIEPKDTICNLICPVCRRVFNFVTY